VSKSAPQKRQADLAAGRTYLHLRCDTLRSNVQGTSLICVFILMCLMCAMTIPTHSQMADAFHRSHFSSHQGGPAVGYTGIAVLVTCFLFALWVGRRLTSRFILHGVLVGVVATLLYVALTLARPEPFAYLVAHGLKILGGVGGGFVAGRRRAPAAATE
jgi:hypothetical protein